MSSLSNIIVLNTDENFKSLALLKLIAQSSIGPKGKLNLLQNDCGGKITLTTSATRLLQLLRVTNPVVKMVLSAATNHLKCHGNYGLYLILLTIELLDHALKLSVPQGRVSCLYQKLFCMSLTHLRECRLRIPVTFDDLTVPMHVLRTTLRSKPACSLSECHENHIAFLLMRCFLNGIPRPECHSQHKFGSFHCISQDGLSPDHTQLLPGILIEKCDMKLIDLLQNRPLKCALFHVSLSGDADTDICDGTWYINAEVNVVSVCTMHILKMCEQLLIDEIDIVACQKVIHPKVKKYLHDHGVLALERLGVVTFEALTEFTSCNPIESFMVKVDPVDFGEVEKVSVIKLHNKHYYHLQNSKSLVSTIYLCNYIEESLEELKVVCCQAIDSLRELVKNPFVYPGGGCLESHLIAYLRNWSQVNISELLTTGISEAEAVLVMESFINSLEKIASVLSENEKPTSDDLLVMHQACKFKKDATQADGKLYWDEQHLAQDNLDKKIKEAINSLNIMDAATTKFEAIKTAFDTCFTLLNVDIIVQKV